MKKTSLVFTLLLSSISFTASSAELTIPNQFSAGSAAVAAEVNGNFSAVETAVDGNAVDIAAILITITALEARVNTLEADNTQLQTDNTQLLADKLAMQNFIDEVLPYLEGGLDAQGQATVFFTGANVHVNNGEGTTGTVNGLGNLIVGYDEALPDETSFFGNAPSFCTKVLFGIFVGAGTAHDNQADCEIYGGVWGDTSQKIGSHNFIVGTGHSYTQYGGLIAGEGNTAAGSYSSISGGALNLARGAYSTVSGGSNNKASGEMSAVSGGFNNTASGLNSSVSGGSENTASGINSSASGGRSGAPDGEDDWVAGNLFQED